MARLFHSILQPDVAIAADGVQVFDLPVNPLSIVWLKIRPLNDTGTLSNYQRALGLAGALDSIVVADKGASVMAMSGRDLVALNYKRHGIVPDCANGDDVDNERRALTVPIIFGKFPYSPMSCYPATRRGELTLSLTIDIADTGYDGMRLGIETTELLDAKPREFERATTIARTFAATGQQDFDLPPGNLVRGLLLFGTTAFAGAAPAPTWGTGIQLLKDNQQVGIAGLDWEVLVHMHLAMGRQSPFEAHTHLVPTNAGAFEETTGVIQDHVEGWKNYGYIDLDPMRDDQFAVDTAGSASFHLRATVGTADAARVVQVERIAA